jgi:hypothetical protein
MHIRQLKEESRQNDILFCDCGHEREWEWADVERGLRDGERKKVCRPFRNDEVMLKIFPTSRRRRSFKDTGFAGEASWMSSNINLVNTSMS